MLLGCGAAVAQRTVNPLVVGSNPTTPATWELMGEVSMNKLSVFFVLGIFPLAWVSAYGNVPKKRIIDYTVRWDYQNIGVIDFDKNRYRFNIDPLKWNAKILSNGKNNKVHIFTPSRKSTEYNHNEMSIFEYDENYNVISAAKLSKYDIEYESKEGFTRCNISSTVNNKCHIIRKEMCPKLKKFVKDYDISKRAKEISKCEFYLSDINKILSLESEKIPKDIENKVLEYKGLAGMNYLRGINFSKIKVGNYKINALGDIWWLSYTFKKATGFCKEYGYLDKTDSSSDLKQGEKPKTITR